MDTTMFTLTFRVACLISTGALVIFCSWKFNKNESTSLVDFQTTMTRKRTSILRLPYVLEFLGIWKGFTTERS